MSKRKERLASVYETYENSYGLTKKQFKLICRTFNELFMRALTETGYKYRLPQRLGFMQIRKRQRENTIPDFNHYVKTGEIIRIRNHHSEGYATKFY